MIRPVILCGGKGSRLWPLSREFYPKQYLAVRGKDSLFLQTVLRSRVIESVAPMVLCNTEHRFLVAEQLQQAGISAEIILEPIGRNTAPAITISALLSVEQDPILLVMPSDHIVEPLEVFKATVEKAADLAEQGKLVTFGVAPDRAETGYGYIRRGESLGEGFKVLEFTEKPNNDAALAYVDSGEYYWNSGMFMFRASTVLKEMEQHAPDILDACKGVVDARTTDLDFTRLDQELFSSCRAESIDYAVMEKTDACAVAPMDLSWKDLGSWSALLDVKPKDTEGNAVVGDVLAYDCHGCYLHSDSKLLAAVGVSDIIAVSTKDAVLVAHKDKSQQVKQIVNRLKAENRDEAFHHTKVYRPWGFYESVDISDRFQVKRITVKPGCLLSLQKHHHRSEHWIVVRGTAQITNGDKEFLLTEDQSTYIPVGNIHRLGNPGKIPLELIEVQTGPYLGEDDIVRLEDVYNRVKE